MSDEKKHKKFKETGFYKFVSEKVVPVIPGTAGIVAEMIIGKKKPIDAIDDVSQLISGNKELKIEFEKFRMNWELEYERIELEFFKAEIEDRTSARQREVNLGRVDWMMMIVGVCFLTAFMYSVWSIFNSKFPTENEKLVYHVLGIIEGAVLGIVGYYFGSSRGSKQKTDAMIQLQKP